MVGEAFGSRHDVDVGRPEVRIAEHHLVSVFPQIQHLLSLLDKFWSYFSLTL